VREKWGQKVKHQMTSGGVCSDALPAKDFSAFVPLSIDPSKSVCLFF